MKEVIERLKEKSSECAFPFVSAETFSMGMSMRDYFAAKAMQKMIWTKGEDDLNAEDCYRIADAMLKARNK